MNLVRRDGLIPAYLPTDPLYPHQRVGIETLAKWKNEATGRELGGCFWLADQMALGKSRQVIEAAQVLWRRGDIDSVIVVCPAAVRFVWFDPELGELSKFHVDPLRVVEYHARSRKWYRTTDPNLDKLTWFVTNYEFIRVEERLGELLRNVEGSRVLLVLDESSAIKNHRAEQTKACERLRKSCKWVWLLNGTPISHSPADLYSQAHVMDPRILNCANFYVYRARYAELGGFKGKQITGWRNLEEVQRKLAPYVLRRELRDCLNDLPPRLPPIALTVPLSKSSWKLYKDLRDEMIAWLDDQTTAVAAQAGVRAMRLAQVCSGFVGGLSVESKCVECNFDPSCLACGGLGIVVKETPPREVGTEKLELLMNFARERFEEDEKLLVWCRFRWEVSRIENKMREESALRGLPIQKLWGGQKYYERDSALRLLDPRTAPPGPALVLGILGTGALGLNLTAASTAVYVSNDYSLSKRLQSEARIDRPGQVRPTSYVDLIATGPEGQKTVDHVIVRSIREKKDLAAWTVAAWKQALIEEVEEY